MQYKSLQEIIIDIYVSVLHMAFGPWDSMYKLWCLFSNECLGSPTFPEIMTERQKFSVIFLWLAQTHKLIPLHCIRSHSLYFKHTNTRIQIQTNIQMKLINMGECSDLHKNRNLPPSIAYGVIHCISNTQIHEYKYKQRNRWQYINMSEFSNLNKHKNLPPLLQSRTI